MNGRFPTKPVYVPESIPISETVRIMEKRGKLKITIKGMTDEALQASINQAGPASTAKDLRPGDEFDGAVMTLPVGTIQPYDRNPRTSANPKYAEIKASIRERGGLKGQLTVTKRPGSNVYMLYMGGNTRLQIVKELYAETKEAHFSQVNCVYHVWKSEADVLASHLIENEARGDTLFIEKACGLIDLVREIERETGKSLSSRNIQAEAAKMGMSVSQSTAALYEFAVANLKPLGLWLTHDNVTSLRRRYAQHETIAKALNKLGEFVNQHPTRMQQFQTEFAETITGRQDVLHANGDQTVIALRGDVLGEFLRGLDDRLTEVLGLDEAAARRVFTALDAAGKEPPSSDTLRALIRGDRPAATDVSTADRVAPASAAVSPTAGDGAKSAPVSAPPGRGGSTPARPGTSATRKRPARLLPGTGEPPSLVPAPIAPHEILSEERFSEIGIWFFSHLADWCALTRITPWLQNGETLDLPYLFWLELPEEIARRGDRDVRLEDIRDPDIGPLDPEMASARSTAYRLVAMLSGQLGGVIEGEDGRRTDESVFATRLPVESAWRAAVQIDFMTIEAFYNVWESQLGGMTAQRTCQLGLAPHDLLSVLQEPMLAEPWRKLTVAYGLWRQALAVWRRQGNSTSDEIQ